MPRSFGEVSSQPCHPSLLMWNGDRPLIDLSPFPLRLPFLTEGYGLLTHYFLKGLQGEGDGNKDGSIEMVELLDYVKPNVQRVARKQYNNEQTPQLLASPELLKRGGGRLLERARP